MRVQRKQEVNVSTNYRKLNMQPTQDRLWRFISPRTSRSPPNQMQATFLHE